MSGGRLGVVLGAAWALLVLGVALRWFPAFCVRTAPRLPGTLETGLPRNGRPFRPPASSARLAGLGAWVVRRARPAWRRSEPVDPVLARRVGGVVAAVPVLAAVPTAFPALAVAAWAAPGLADRRRERRHLAEVEAALPEAVDLLALSVGAGLSVGQALAAVGERGYGALADELARVAQEASLGRRLADALDDLPARAGDAVRPLVAALVAAERYGAPLGAGLERLADEARRRRRQRAEEAARRVPVLLLFPLVFCILPAFALLTVVPAIASALGSLRL